MLSDKTLNDPPWVVEIDGVKFATPEPVVLLLKEVSEERDALEAREAALREALGYALDGWQGWAEEGLDGELREKVLARIDKRRELLDA